MTLTLDYKLDLMSQALRKLSGAINKSKQMQYSLTKFVKKSELCLVARKLLLVDVHLNSTHLCVLMFAAAKQLKQGNDIVGNKTRIRVVKNKVAPPFRLAEVDIMYGFGISKEGEIVDLGTDAEVVQRSGSWYSYEGERLGQGRENAKQFLMENPAI